MLSVETMDLPLGQLLYDGSNIKKTTSWHSIMHYAVSNRLSYKAIEEFIDLIQVSS